MAALTGRTACGSRVYKSRVLPIQEEVELPCILVYGRSEECEVAASAPLRYKRNLVLSVEIVAQAADDLDDTLDAIAEVVETELFKDPTLGDLTDDLFMRSTEQEILPTGDTLVGVCRINFETPYETTAVEEANESPFESVRAEWVPSDAPDTGTVETVDTVELEQ